MRPSVGDLLSHHGPHESLRDPQQTQGVLMGGFRGTFLFQKHAQAITSLCLVSSSLNPFVCG